MWGLLVLLALLALILSLDKIIELIGRIKRGPIRSFDQTYRKAERKKHYENRLYGLLIRAPILGTALLNLQEKIYYITPYNSVELKMRTITIFAQRFFVAVLAGIITFFFNTLCLGKIDLMCFAVSMVCGYVVFNGLINGKIYEMEDEADEELNRYLAYVKHEYYAHRKTAEAVISAAETMSYDMRTRARDIYTIIKSGNAKDRVYDYVNDQKRGMFQRLFMTQVYHAARHGDKWNGTESLLCKNIDYLRKDIPTYRVRRKEHREHFFGYTASIVLPLLVMNALRRYGSSFSSDMVSFYQTLGYVVQVMNLFLTVVIYNFFQKKKEMSNSSVIHLSNTLITYIERNNVVERQLKKYDGTFFMKRIKARLDRIGSDITPHGFVIKTLITSLGAALLVFGIFIYSHAGRRAALSTTVVYEEQLSSASQRQQETVYNTVIALIGRYKSSNLNTITEARLIKDIEETVAISNYSLKEAMAETVIKQVVEYQSEHVQWYEIVLVISALLVGVFQYFEIVYYDRLTKQAKEEEVRMFQMIVLLEKDFESTSVAGLLNEFESHAVYFKESLRQAVLMYGKDRNAALDGLVDYTSPEFSELVSSLKAVYNCGIRAAFSETELNMMSEADMQRMTQDISFKRSMDIVDMLRVVPAVMSFGAYFLVPFLTSSIGGVKEVLSVLNGM